MLVSEISRNNIARIQYISKIELATYRLVMLKDSTDSLKHLCFILEKNCFLYKKHILKDIL